jgi:hypothetical protein
MSLRLLLFGIFSDRCTLSTTTDPVFHASQTLASDAEVISSAEATIKACETEVSSRLSVLKLIARDY